MALVRSVLAMRLTREEIVEHAHESSVWSLAWCPDQTLLTGSLDESVILWAADSSGTLRKKHTFLAHGLGTVQLAVHCKGQYAAASSLDGCVRVWDLQDPSKKLHHFQAAASENWGVDFAPDPENVILAVAGGMTSTVSVFTLGEEPRKLSTLELPKVREEGQKNQRQSFVLACRFSPDGRQIVGTCDNGLVVLFDVETGKALHTLSENTSPVRTAAFSTNSELLVTGSDAAAVTIYDVLSGGVVGVIDSRVVKDAGPYEDPSMFLDLSFHPDGRHFTACAANGKICLWHLTSRERLQVIEEHTDAVWSAQFRPDGAKLASACEDGSLGLFSVIST